MKALDHVALWYARVFTTFLLIGGCVWPAIVLHDGRFAINLMALVFLLWAISCWCLNREIVRLYLGLSSGLALLAIMYLLGWNYSQDSHIELKYLLFPGFLLGSFASLIWIAIRSPQRANSGSTPSKSQHKNTSPSRRPFWFHFFTMFLKIPLPSFR